MPNNLWRALLDREEPLPKKSLLFNDNKKTKGFFTQKKIQKMDLKIVLLH